MVFLTFECLIGDTQRDRFNVYLQLLSVERRGIGTYLEKMVFPLRFLLAGARLSGCSMVRRCNVLSVFLG